VRYAATAQVSTPDLVLIAPGVYVVAHHHDSVFYSDGWYWRYGDGVWYRSSVYTGGWVAYRQPPRAVLRIDHPRAYAHYRGHGRAKARDHRGGQQGGHHGSVRDRRQQPPPRGRDHRDHHH
jgi:hypothetical protein